MAQPNNIDVVLDDQTLAEVEQALEVLKAKLLPLLKSFPSQNRPGSQILDDLAFLQDLQGELKPIATGLEDTLLLRTNAAYQRALDFYNHLRIAGKSDPQAAAIYEELSALLPRAKPTTE